jgi:hypothetical protein
MRFVIASSLLVLGALPLAAQTQTGAKAPMQIYPATAGLQWRPGPPALPKGVMMVILEGDPAVAGMFTMRLKFPGGTKVMPHFHSATEHATVISGALHIGMGDTFDQSKATTMSQGSFGFWPAGMHHYGWFDGETVLQLHGQGPWTVTYVNPADDPRLKKP